MIPVWERISTRFPKINEFLARMSKANPVRAAGLFVFRMIEDKAQYLLLQASERTRHWTPPKGHVDEGESELVAAQRETKEEAGIAPGSYQIYEEFQSALEYMAWGKPKRVVYWPARLLNNDVEVKLSEEHVDYKWAELSIALVLLDRKDIQKCLMDVDEFIKKKLVN